MRPTDRTGLAIVLSLLALTLFDCMGLVIKHLSDRYTAVELSAWRNLFGLLPAVIALQFSSAWRSNGRPLRIRQWRLAIARGLIVTVAQLCFYISLGVLAFATASTITYANALFMTAMAVPLLGERVGWVRWCAVLIGFVGVILVVQPGSDAFTPYALLPLAAALFYAFVGVSARMVDEAVPSALLSLYSSFTAVVASILIVFVWGGFSPIETWNDFAWIAAMGAFGGTAVLFLVFSYRMAEQSNLAPFNYFGIPLAFFLGWLFFDEAPWDSLFPGALLIVGGGLMIIWRERRLRRALQE